MNTIAVALGLALPLAACGVSNADVKLARSKLSGVRVAESLVQNTRLLCEIPGSAAGACEDHRRAKDKLEAAREDLVAFCTGRVEACEQARRLEGLPAR